MRTTPSRGVSSRQDCGCWCYSRVGLIRTRRIAFCNPFCIKAMRKKSCWIGLLDFACELKTLFFTLTLSKCMLRAYKTFDYNFIESRAHTRGSARAIRSMSLMSTQFAVTCVQGFASCYQEVPCIWRRSIEDVHRRCNYWDTI